MIISCPVCAQQYTMAPTTLGADGKIVRCSNCGNKWRATQDSLRPPPPPQTEHASGVYAAPRYQPTSYHQPSIPPQQAYYPQQPGYPMAPPMQAMPGQPYYSQPGQMPPPYPGVPQGTPQGIAQPVQDPEQAYAAPPQPVPAAKPAPQPEYKPEPMPEPEPFDEDEDEDEDEMAADVVSAIDSMFEDDEDEDEGEDLPTAEELDAMFEGEDDPETMESFVSNQDGDAMDFMDPDDIPDEEVSAVFTSPLTKKPESKGGFLRFMIISVLIISGLGAGLFLGREMIVTALPQAEDLYAMIGLEDKSLGAGLEIRAVKSERDDTGGKDAIVVWGTIANITEKARPVPMIRVSLYDARNAEVQFIMVAPEKQQLEGGSEIGFKAQLVDPVPTARRLEVTFSNAEQTESGKAQ